MLVDDCEKAVCVMYGFLNENKVNKVCYIMFWAKTTDHSHFPRCHDGSTHQPCYQPKTWLGDVHSDEHFPGCAFGLGNQ